MASIKRSFVLTYPAEHWCISFPSTFIILGILGPHKSTSSIPTCQYHRKHAQRIKHFILGILGPYKSTSRIPPYNITENAINHLHLGFDKTLTSGQLTPYRSPTNPATESVLVIKGVESQYLTLSPSWKLQVSQNLFMNLIQSHCIVLDFCLLFPSEFETGSVRRGSVFCWNPLQWYMLFCCSNTFWKTLFCNQNSMHI